MMLNENQREVILALADNDLNVAKTARSIYLHRNSVTYQIATIKKATGLDPTTLSGIEQLLWRMEDEDAQRVLKPCPFCGGEAVLDFKQYARNLGFRASVRCRECAVGIVAPKVKMRLEAEECALAIWNRRVKKCSAMNAEQK